MLKKCKLYETDTVRNFLDFINIRFFTSLKFHVSELTPVRFTDKFEFNCPVNQWCQS